MHIVAMHAYAALGETTLPYLAVAALAKDQSQLRNPGVIGMRGYDAGASDHLYVA
jgi:hypothetical protein